jgi:hypothetical protein
MGFRPACGGRSFGETASPVTTMGLRGKPEGPLTMAP